MTKKKLTTEMCSPDCAEGIKHLHDTMYVIGGKWKLAIIISLSNGHKRYREIARSISGITFKMLSKELKEMEMNKLLSRTVYQDTPVLIEYELTEYSKTLTPIITEMINWGKNHRKVI